MERNIYFPSFSSFPIFSTMLFTAIFLFLYVLNDSGILCVMLMLYLFLISVHKILDAGCLIFTIACGVCICEVKVLYAALPHIFLQLSNGFVFILCHIFLIHYGIFVFLEFGFNKLKEQDRAQLVDLNLILMITFPTIVASIWAYASSLFVDISLVPYIAVALTFLCHQAVFRIYNNAGHDCTLSSRPEVPLSISVVQLLSGVGTHAVITMVSMFRCSPKWTSVVFDQLGLWSVGVLFVTLLPTSRLLVSCCVLSRQTMGRATKLSGIACYLLTMPTLYLHGVHFHMARLMFAKMCVLATGLVVASRISRKTLPLVVALALIIAMMVFELPWGTQLLPNTSLFLERIYAGVIFMTGSALVAMRSLGISSRLSTKNSVMFQFSFLALVSAFHVTESSLYFVNLVPSPSVVVTALLVLIVQACISSGRLGAVACATIDCQVGLKLMAVLTHWSTGGARVNLGVLTSVAGLVFGFVVSLSLRTTSEPPLWLSALKSVLLGTSLIVLRDSVLMYALYDLTNEQLLTRLSFLQCTAASTVLDLLVNSRREGKSWASGATAIRVVLALAAVTLLISTTLPLGVMLIGLYLMKISKDGKWDLNMEMRNSMVLSGASAFIMVAVPGSVPLDIALLALSAFSSHLLHKLVSQSSVRVLKRLFMRIWVTWALSWLLVLALMVNDSLRFVVAVGVPLLLSLSLARTSRCLQSTLDGGGSVDSDTRIISRTRIVCLAQCISSGLLVLRFQFSSPMTWILPLCLVLLEKYPCVCDRKELISRRINPLSLSISLCGIFLLFGTFEESSLFLSSILRSANDLSLQLDMVLTIKSWFELLLSLLLGLGHFAMLFLSVVAVKAHNCVEAKSVPNIDVLITIYTLIVPLSLGFLFCSSSISSALLALLSFTSGLRFLLL